MKTDIEYSFNVSLSLEAFYNKEISGAMIGSSKDPENRRIRELYGFKRGISYRRQEVSCRSLLDNLIHGKVFCHLFNPQNTRVDGSFGSSEKTNENFTGSWVIGVDIDKTDYFSMEDYIETLTLKPSIAYTSYSNKQYDQVKLCNKGARFRLIYVFDELIDNPYRFRYAAWKLNRKLEEDSGEIIEDQCNLRCSQYFNGTNIENSSLITSYSCSDIIYSLSDLGVSDEGYLEFLENYGYYNSVTSQRTREIKSEMIKEMDKLGISLDDEKPSESKSEASRDNIEPYCSPQLISDMKRLSYDEFMKYNRHKYKYSYRVESDDWEDGIYQKVDDNYFSLYWNVSRVKDGQKRRKKLFQRICLRRVMNPSITADDLLFCAYEDRQRFFEIDQDLDIDCLVRNVESAMNLSIADIEEQNSKTLEYLRGRKKGCYIFKAGEYSSKADLKAVNWSKIAEIYDPSKTVKENLEEVKKVINISERTLRVFCKENGIKTDRARLTDEELRYMLKPELSARKNYQILRDEGYKVDDKRVKNLLREMKS